MSKLKKEAAQARLSLHLTKCHIVGNLMSWLNYSNILQMNSTSKLVLIFISVSMVLSVPVEVSKYVYTFLRLM